VVARHEAGHAVVGTAVANILTGQPRVEVINITGTLTVWCRFLYLLLFTYWCHINLQIVKLYPWKL
jgi:hypothetical protein